MTPTSLQVSDLRKEYPTPAAPLVVLIAGFLVTAALGVPLAALGFMSPVLCAAAMGFSDLIVIGNALRLRRWRLESKL